MATTSSIVINDTSNRLRTGQLVVNKNNYPFFVRYYDHELNKYYLAPEHSDLKGRFVSVRDIREGAF